VQQTTENDVRGISAIVGDAQRDAARSRRSGLYEQRQRKQHSLDQRTGHERHRRKGQKKLQEVHNARYQPRSKIWASGEYEKIKTVTYMSHRKVLYSASAASARNPMT
jgi:hypothetical protein